MPPELAQWIPPAVIVGVMLYLHRSLRQQIESRMDRMEARLHQDTAQLRDEVRDLREHVDHQIGDLRERMGRLEERMARLGGTLDVLREFFVRNGRGTAA